MHKSATKCNETQGKWCKNKHGASKIIDTLETYHYVMTEKFDKCILVTRNLLEQIARSLVTHSISVLVTWS
jgi:hypothetical protein